MKALVFEGPNELKLRDVPLPEPGEDEILVKVAACLICGTDLRIFRGAKTRGVRIPSILGHEFAGVVEATGVNVKEFHVGDRVGVAPVIPCHTCFYCKNGLENVCANRTALGYEYEGAFAEYVCIPAPAVKGGNVYHLPSNISLEEAALAEPLACCLNGHHNSKVKLGDVVVILGAGPIGLMHLQLAKSSGASYVIISEPNEHRRAIAKEFGADRVVDPQTEDLNSIVKNVTDGLGADIIFLAIGIPALAQDALTLVKKGGTINFFAGFSVGDKAALDVNLIHYNEIKITGTSAARRDDYRKALDLIAKGKVKASKMITHRFPLDKAEEAFRIAGSSQGIKVAIIP
ncbi:zinc-dependent dehydrogenase [Neomoorella thermoacetica]|uniref:D-arabitol-phosphate dehydrogenase n=2 Tax=Neomoorella thermoacetica TaxID=1525 RepID=A0A1D7X7Q5_NEOTH|nr:zinc-dependent dehydrogenase [Moorella thermoacetica]AKX93226.1 D-arabitol-phosphate dehydrogenase [Moorella thermoacetica]AKX95868.1 D-arabitol-phosphate dehydrogenase [Moorella thermoacetica]AOQ22927.1 D-arabitol-phosphate dehydrogenase [Moorella thermoacetica]OIQ08286.1 D-arabitol-phosphate dehydrogenase [Moorella thermoacetica]OIQ11671.1 D-arabitol-phosphate dehydrogenase [Moorella thermoacetica]